MQWIDSIGRAIDYIEENITAPITVGDISQAAYISPFYFQKGFTMLCGFTVAEYIRQRRLALAGIELLSTDAKIIDIAVKYCFDSADGFTKAFTRFHGATPTAVRKNGAAIKSFTSLKIKVLLEGGSIMDFKIVDKESFKVIGKSKTFTYEEAFEQVPKFWAEHYQNGDGSYVCGMYGINIDKSMEGDKFEYLIADDYTAGQPIKDGFEIREIPKHTWAVFSCTGAMPHSLQELNKAIFTQWLPNCKEYKIAEGYNIELYTDLKKYPKGLQDENYYSECWVPVTKK